MEGLPSTEIFSQEFGHDLVGPDVGHSQNEEGKQRLHGNKQDVVEIVRAQHAVVHKAREASSKLSVKLLLPEP